MKAELDHIGIAVMPDSPLAKLLGIVGLPVVGSERVESEQVQVDWVPLPPRQAQIELIRGTSPESKISTYLAKKGKDGIHHICLRVPDLQQMMGKVEKAGFRFVYDKPHEGADHCLVNFVHPATTGGVLIELSQEIQS